MHVNGGNRTVPTVVFADGSALTNPQRAAGQGEARRLSATWRPLADRGRCRARARRLARRRPTASCASPSTAHRATEPDACGRALIDPLRARGRPAVHVRARAASGATRRCASSTGTRTSTVLPDLARRRGAAPRGARRRPCKPAAYLPSLRDPASNRSTRAAPRAARPGSRCCWSAAPCCSGSGLPVRPRRAPRPCPPTALRPPHPRDAAWTLPAFAEYERDRAPGRAADVVISVDRRTPAVRGLRCRHRAVPRTT